MERNRRGSAGGHRPVTNRFAAAGPAANGPSSAGVLRADYIRIVQNNQSGPNGVSSKSLPARIGVTLLVLATLYLCYFGRLGAVGFVGNEARYASIARAMADT